MWDRWKSKVGTYFQDMWSTRKVDYATIQLEPETETGLVQAKTKNGVELDWNQIVYLCAKTKILNEMKKKIWKKKQNCIQLNQNQ